MQRRNTLLAGSALLLTNIAACTYNRTVHPEKLECKDDNGCPSGYWCRGVTVEQDGFCCSSPDETKCVRPGADAGRVLGDGSLTDSSSDGFARADGSAGSDADRGSDGSIEKPASDANAPDRVAPPDSGTPDPDAVVQADGPGDASQPDLAGAVSDATVQADAKSLLDTGTQSDAPIIVPSDAPIVIPTDALVQQDAAALPDALALNDTAAAQDAPFDVPVVSIPDGASNPSSDAPIGAGPQITSIEGTGTASAVAPRAEDLAAWNAREADRVPASHRFSGTNPVLVVTGTALDAVTLATLNGQSGQGNHDMTIEEKTMTTLRLRWPSTLTAGGLFVLSLTAAAGTANAQVFFLQGEKGDKGDQGDSLFSCAGNNCSTTKSVSVGGLTSNGVYLGPETTRTVNLSHTMSADQIQTAIDAVGKHVPYGASVTFQFADGTYTLNHPLTFQGFDGGGRILVLGNRAESAGLHTDQAVFLDFSGQDCDGILAYGNSATAEIDFLKIMVKSDSAGTAAVKASWDSFVEMSGDYVTGTFVSTQSFGVYMDYGGMLKVSGTYFSNIHYALTACYGSTVSSDGNGSTGTSPSYSLYAVYGGTIAKNSSQPAGPEIATAGGEIR